MTSQPLGIRNKRKRNILFEIVFLLDVAVQKILLLPQSGVSIVGQRLHQIFNHALQTASDLNVL
jgi:hypothetical protein